MMTARSFAAAVKSCLCLYACTLELEINSSKQHGLATLSWLGSTEPTYVYQLCSQFEEAQIAIATHDNRPLKHSAGSCVGVQLLQLMLCTVQSCERTTVYST